VRLVDAHAHLGPDRLFDLPTVAPEQLVETMDRYGIDASLAMPQPGIDDPPTEHTHIADAAARWPGRLYGIALPDLRGPKDSYWREAERCVRELGFVALKYHTAGHAVSPTSSLGALPFEVASALGVPLMVHTGFQPPYALPSLVGARARSFPDLTIVMAHAGMAPYWYEAVDVAQTQPNVYLETSWLPVYALRRAIDLLGPSRVMFGADVGMNVPVEQAKYAVLSLAAPDRAAVLGGTAERVFGLPPA
jgi:uncharacterized protein